MSRRSIYLVGGIGAAAASYYLYNAGGRAKVAEDRFEGDARRAAAKVKAHLPGRHAPDAEKTMADYGARAGAGLDEISTKTEQQIGKAKENLNAFAKDQSAAMRETIDNADTKIQKKTSEAKNGIGSWLGISGGGK